jgi:hypothetical protein
MLYQFLLSLSTPRNLVAAAMHKWRHLTFSDQAKGFVEVAGGLGMGSLEGQVFLLEGGGIAVASLGHEGVLDGFEGFLVEFLGNEGEDFGGCGEVLATHIDLLVDDLIVLRAADGMPKDAFEARLESFVKHGFEMLDADVLVAEAKAVGEVVVELVPVGEDAESPFAGAVVAGIILDPLEDLFEGEGAVGEFLEKEGGDFFVGLEGGDVLADEVLLFEGELVLRIFDLRLGIADWWSSRTRLV